MAFSTFVRMSSLSEQNLIITTNFLVSWNNSTLMPYIIRWNIVSMANLQEMIHDRLVVGISDKALLE